MKKLVLCVPTLEQGGAERVTVRLAAQFISKYEVTIITLRKGNKEYPISKEIQRINIEDGNFLTKLKVFRKTIKQINPEFIIIMFAPMYIFIFISLLGLDYLQIVSERNDPKNFSGKKIIKYLYQFLIMKADGIVFQTKDARNFYITKNTKVLNTIIYNPICVNELPDKYKGNRKKTIVNVGRLHQQKNQKLLIDAMVDIHFKIPNYNLIIYGEGPLRNYLQKYIDSKNATNYILLYGSSNNILNEINDKSLFILSSNFEGMPNTLLEAMSLGMPVISTNCPCGGPAEVICNNINGILVDVGNKEQIKNSILRLIKNPKEAERLGNNGYKIRDKLDISIIANQWIDFCNYVKEEQKKC